MELSREQMYQAILQKDLSFEGVFFTCVKTTGIFCRPTCTARKPKLENVEFVPSSKLALSKGYRPCKICAPLKNVGEPSEALKALLEEIQENPSTRITDWELRKRHLEPHTVRRWFLKHHGMTFQAYQRLLRLNTAFKRLQQGETVTETAFSTGYESLSGFGDSFKAIFGVSPKKGKQQGVIDLCRLETPLGTMFAAAVPEGICLLEFTDRKMLETEFKALAKHYNATILPGDNPHFPRLKTQLEEYFSGARKEFDLPLAMPGTAFQQSVWQELMTIPYGITRSYADQATALQKPGAVRAVALANGMNRISIIVPCHRIIGSDGSLTGYGGGLWRKRWLLDWEREHLSVKRV
ncbi:MAG TPA: methylated-DNA--[protein]-cysteine S-methyltransferase [Saprospiraceae bacterium]|nr:methylated-DNA--[protein]-cysteine S-methyltransferase [Saprospiraceae bacterium]